ncbi:hypothetical protein [Sphingobium limneticum]
MAVVIADPTGKAVTTFRMKFQNFGMVETVEMTIVFDFDCVDALEIDRSQRNGIPATLDLHVIPRRAFEIGDDDVVGTGILPSGVNGAASLQQGQGRHSKGDFADYLHQMVSAFRWFASPDMAFMVLIAAPTCLSMSAGLTIGGRGTVRR